MSTDVNRDLWLVLLGVALNREHSRDDLLRMVDVGDAPPEIGRLLQALVDQERGPVAKWLDERGVGWGNGLSAIEAVAQKVTADADEGWWVKQCMLMRGLPSKKPDEIVVFLEEVLARMRGRIGQ